MELLNSRPSELLIRPSHIDHVVVADMLSGNGRRARLPNGKRIISRLVLDAHRAKIRDLADAAATVGTPCLVDPLTPFLQGQLRPNDPWAALPFGVAKRLEPTAFETESAKDRLVSQVIEFETMYGASAVIPPYFLSSGLGDPWHELNLDMIRRTRTMAWRQRLRIPIFPVFAQQIASIGKGHPASPALEELILSSVDLEASAVGLCLSPAGAPDDRLNKVARLFRATEWLAEHGIPIISWRQGIYGLALTAVGARGYEVGIGASEQANLWATIRNRRPSGHGDKRSGSPPGIYLQALGRSHRPKVVRALLSDLRFRATLMCDDERCCPLGVTSTILHNPREHAVTTRAKALDQLDEMPRRSWRLDRIARDARAAAVLIDQINRAFADPKDELAQYRLGRMDSTGAWSLARVAEEMLPGQKAS